ncbi:hypothetical protein [Microaerobacter geothermalis]|uniref:hypothetical protein n=1 Tax=Microaerobacter geothermalis TaxID=674972 RepID=UPI001F35BF24|nr:hypothetical protein [Microaerobacter geothermalis]
MFGIFLYWLGYFTPNLYKSPIEIEQIPKVLNLTNPPSIPNNWVVQSVEKYDDGFLSPIITIYYNNNISLTLSEGKIVLPNKDKKLILIGNKTVTVYKDGGQVYYVVKHNKIFYFFRFERINQNVVEKFIETLG